MNKNEFIAIIAPIISEVAANRGYKLVSPIIAQACLESGFGNSKLASKYHNYFGMKCGSKWTGPSVNMKTMEEYTPGQYTKISDNFRVYSDMRSGVEGYFDFISTARYKNLIEATTYEEYLTCIKQDGYATSSSYVINCMKIVDQYHLDDYDNNSGLHHENDSEVKYYPRYVGNSYKIDEVFKSIGAPNGNYRIRKSIAVANGITDYTGKLSENMKLIQMAKNGQLKM